MHPDCAVRSPVWKCVLVFAIFDTDKFIQTVEENPPIWEKGTKEYSDRGAKEKCWFNVGAGMFENWEEMTDADKQSQLKDLKNKWRHIRDNFAKYINQKKSGDSAAKRKKYIYADALSFLLQSMSKRRRSGNFEFETERQEEDGEKENPEIEGTSETDQPPPEAFKKRRGKTAEMSVLQQQLLQKLEHSESVADDSDKAFMLSILPDIKLLMNCNKKDKKTLLLDFLRAEIRSIGYGWAMETIFISTICLLRKLFGRFYYSSVVFLPGFLSGLALILETTENQVLDGLIFFNSVLTCYMTKTFKIKDKYFSSIAGLFCGLTYAMSPNIQVLVIAITTLLQIIYHYICEHFKVTNHFWQRLLLFMCCHGYLLHQKFFNPKICSPYYSKMIDACTNNMTVEIYNSLIRTFFM
ncbi:hypothetical protein JTB14_025458 [Gonioctena quinquepunctata]|nr:hypothetical protein JTB14_025458 [Gonioctena quinquepunctata]